MLTLDEMIAKAKAGDIHAFGAALSPLDDRDYIQYPPAPGAPDSVVIPGVGYCPVYNQQGATCTGYSIGACMSYLEFKETGVVRSFDGAEIHHRRVFDWNAGVWPREVLEDVRVSGAEAPYDASSSALYRIAGYAGVPLDPDSILTALAATGPIQVVTWLGKAFMDQWYNKTDAFIPAPPSRVEESLHSMLIVAGYRGQGVVIQNNWGVEAGVPFGGIKGGFHKVSWEWLRTQGCEAWAMSDAKNDNGVGWIRNHSEVVRESGFALVKRPDRTAVYVVINQTRDWISSQNELYARGLGGKPIEIRDRSDAVWGYPVLGEDAPVGSRA